MERTNAIIASLLICSLPSDLSADISPIRLSIQTSSDPREDAAPMLNALSREFRKLDGVSITDKEPALKIDCIVIQNTISGTDRLTGYSASYVVTGTDDHLILHGILAGNTLDQLAHDIAIRVDGGVIDKMRWTAQPSSSP